MKVVNIEKNSTMDINRTNYKIMNRLTKGVDGLKKTGDDGTNKDITERSMADENTKFKSRLIFFSL